MQRIDRLLCLTYSSKSPFKFGGSSTFRLFSTNKPSDDASQDYSSGAPTITKTPQGDLRSSLADETTKTDASDRPSRTTESETNDGSPVSFATLLRRSNLMHLGDPEGKIITGKIFEVVNNDLYIDFGWKFHCVCPKPIKNSSDYVRGAKVRLRIKDLELSTKFLGATKDVTLLEADCVLLGLMWTPSKINKTDADTSAYTEQLKEEAVSVQ